MAFRMGSSFTYSNNSRVSVVQHTFRKSTLKFCAIKQVQASFGGQLIWTECFLDWSQFCKLLVRSQIVCHY
jgi:hypothetical protein